MAHKTFLYDVERGFGDDDVMRPSQIIESDDANEMLRIATEAITASGSIMAARIQPDWRLSETLDDHLKACNLLARWLEENPIGDAWISALHEDLDAWGECGVHSPEDLEKYLLLQSFSDQYKEDHGFRPRGAAVTMDMSLDEIETALGRGPVREDIIDPCP